MWYGYRELYHNLGIFPFLRVYQYFPVMAFGNDIVAQRQAQTRTLAAGLGCKKRLKNLLFDIWRYTDAIVLHPDFDTILHLARTYFYLRLVLPV